MSIQLISINPIQPSGILKTQSISRLMENGNIWSFAYKIFIKNNTLFGNNKWILFKKLKEYKYETLFIGSLELINNNSIILNTNQSNNISNKYQNKILNSKYLICINENKIFEIL